MSLSLLSHRCVSEAVMAAIYFALLQQSSGIFCQVFVVCCKSPVYVLSFMFRKDITSKHLLII